MSELPEHARLLRAIRHVHGWSQERLAAELCVSVRTVRRWENDEVAPNVRDLVLFRALLGDVAGSFSVA